MPKEKAEEDEELEEFIKQFEANIIRLKKIAPILHGRKDLQNKINIFYNAYNQRQLTKTTKNLVVVTFLLVLATTIQTISTVYGQEAADSAIMAGVQLLVVVIIFIMCLAVLEISFNIVEKISFLIKRLIKKKEWVVEKKG